MPARDLTRGLRLREAHRIDAAPTQAPEPATRVLSHRDFRRYLSAVFLGILAIQIQSVAVSWQIYSIARSPLALGYVGLFQMLALARPAVIWPFYATLALFGAARAGGFELFHLSDIETGARYATFTDQLVLGTECSSLLLRSLRVQTQ
jgi:hypothetical protein